MKAVAGSFEFAQESDCCDPDNLGQNIIVTVDDGGGGPFVIIQTDRWAMDDIDEFANQLKSILGMVKAEEGSE
jgi:hypothetical protein